MLKIITVPNNILNQKAKPVKDFNNDIKKLIEEMKKTLLAQKDPPGVGLAAPQVGKSLALFIMKPTVKSPITIFINPKIIKISELNNKPSKSTKRISPNDLNQEKSNLVKLEGCLSIPKIWSPVKRAKKVLLQYQNLTGAVVQKWFTGFEAVIIQHEDDHLNGILFTQRAIEQKVPLYEEKDGELKKLEY